MTIPVCPVCPVCPVRPVRAIRPYALAIALHAGLALGIAPASAQQSTTNSAANPAPPAAAAAVVAPSADSPARTGPTVDLANTPTLYVVGYAHLDTEWRWAYPQTIRDYVKDTMHKNFPLFEKYPNYVFNFSGSRRYQFMQEYFPADYARVKQYVAANRWFPCGSSVDEGDANVPSSESFIRQVLYGNRFFRREFGFASEEFMLPDCFGFPAAMPTMLAHCGLKGFSTQKLTWGSASGIPFKVGLWEGPDGSTIIAALDPGNYVGNVTTNLANDPAWLKRLQDNKAASGLAVDYHYYGTGDMGGSPTEGSVAMVQQSSTTAGPIKVISGPADWMFRAITPDMQRTLPRYKGDLLLTEHSAGSVTSQAAMKRWNRKNEFLAWNAELLSVGAAWLGGPVYPSQRLEDAWTLLLGSQMHDILPGTSLPKAYEYAWNDELLAANIFGDITLGAIEAVAAGLDTRGEGEPVIIFNPLSAPRRDVVELTLPATPQGDQLASAVGPDGEPRPAQIIQRPDGSAVVIFLADAVPCGVSVWHVRMRPASNAPVATSLSVADRAAESARFRVRLDDRGDIASVFDKQLGREVLSGPSRLALLYEKPSTFPAWNMDWKDRKNPPREHIGETAEFIRTTVVENGPVRVTLQVERKDRGSLFTQRIRLVDRAQNDPGDHVEVDTAIDWVTPERSLKATFPLAVANQVVTYDDHVGVVERPTNNPKCYEHPVHYWADLSAPDMSWGVTVLNDSKFGMDKPSENQMRLTLLYTPAIDGVDYADQRSQDFGRHELKYAIMSHAGDWKAGGSAWAGLRFNQPLRAFWADRTSDGPLGKSFSLVSISDSNVLAAAIKKSEEGDRVIVRLRELNGQARKGVRVGLAGAVRAAVQVDGQERDLKPVTVQDGQAVIDVPAFGLVALALSVAPPAQGAALPQRASAPIPIVFDTDVVSPDAAPTDGTMERVNSTDGPAQALSFPAEQWPARVTLDGVPLTLGPAGSGQLNALTCAGQTLALPDGTWDRVELLMASSADDATVSIATGDSKAPCTVPSWRGFIGQWDNRLWAGQVPELAFQWTNELAGLVPGYVKPAPVAWFSTHHHAPTGNAYYQFCYLFRVTVPLAADSRSIVLPGDARIKLFAATATRGWHARSPVDPPADRASARAVRPGLPLSDTLANHGGAGTPSIMANGNPNDFRVLDITPPLYWKAGTLRYTLDGRDPTPSSPAWDPKKPVLLHDTTDVRAAMVDADHPGPIAVNRIQVNDSTPPRVLRGSATFRSASVTVEFSEPLDPVSAADAANYSVQPPITVKSASLSADARTVELTLADPVETDKPYRLTISGVKDRSPRGNPVQSAPLDLKATGPVFELERIAATDLGAERRIDDLPVKADQPFSINVWVRIKQQIPSRTIILGFGRADDKLDGAGRYLCRFPSGVWFWGRHRDVKGSQDFDLNRWQMITAAYDGQRVRLYKDGKEIGSRALSFVDDEPVLRIAPLDPWESLRRFQGDLAGLTIWNSALSAGSIKVLQQSPPKD